MSFVDDRQPELLTPRRVLFAGGVGIALTVAVVGLWQRPVEFWATYLTAVVFWLGTSLGCLAIALLHALTGGRWGDAMARELRAGIAAGLVGLAAAIPIGFGATILYPGAGSDAAATQSGVGSQKSGIRVEGSGPPSTTHHSPLTMLNEHQRQYLAMPLVIGRLVLAALVWCALGAWIVRWHVRQCQQPGNLPSPRKAALGLVGWWLTVTFAVVDGILSLTPGWFSSMFPPMEIVGFGLAGMAFAILVRGLAGPKDAEADRNPQAGHDQGNMLLAFNIMWVYLAFSQYLIIWSGDLPREVSWYVARRTPLASGVSVGLLALHFVVPLGLLLSRDLKRNAKRLAGVAGLLLAMRLVSLAWTILPSTGAAGTWAGVLLVANVAAVGGVWLFAFSAARRRLPMPAGAHARTETAQGTAR